MKISPEIFIFRWSNRSGGLGHRAPQGKLFSSHYWVMKQEPQQLFQESEQLIARTEEHWARTWEFIAIARKLAEGAKQAIATARNNRDHKIEPVTRKAI